MGIFAPVPLTDISDDAWQEIFDINVMSGVRLSRALVPRMIERGCGRIIFISSESGIQIPAEMVHYGVSRHVQVPEADIVQNLSANQSRGDAKFVKAARYSGGVKLATTTIHAHSCSAEGGINLLQGTRTRSGLALSLLSSPASSSPASVGR